MHLDLKGTDAKPVKFLRGKADETSQETHSSKEKSGSDSIQVMKTQLYKYCYITGANLIRQKRRTVKKIKLGAKNLFGFLYTRGTVLFGKLRSLTSSTKQEISQPVRSGFEWTLDMEEKFRAARKEGRTGAYLLESTKRGASSLAHSLWHSRNYVLPALSIGLLLLSISFYRGLTIALSVEYGGEHIGYVKSEADFDAAEKQMKGRIVFEEYVHPDDYIPRFSLKIIDSAELTEVDELTNKIILASGNELTEGHGLYIDGKFVGAADDERPLTSMLDAIKDKYRTGDPDEIVEFVKEVEIKEGLYPTTSIVSVRSLQDKVQSDETEKRTYIVQSGDAPTLIADKYNMAYSDLKKLNPTIEQSLLVGQEVLIERSVPMLGVQVSKTEVYNEDIPFTITHIQDTTQLQGYTKVQQVGQKGVTEITAQVTYVDGVEVSRTVVETKVLKDPVEEKMIVGGKLPLQQLPASSMSGSTNFIWPVDGGYLTAGFYGYAGHTGMDIATKAGVGVRASASGTVELAQYYTGNAYGKYVIINHGGGVKTLYAHNSEIYVQVGQWVEQGELIAAVGRTGNATGTHCHFEIIINGVRMNPASYIGTVYNR